MCGSISQVVINNNSTNNLAALSPSSGTGAPPNSGPVHNAVELSSGGIPVEPEQVRYPFNDAKLFDPEVLKVGGYETLDNGKATDPDIISMLSKFIAQQRSLQQLMDIEPRRSKGKWKTVVSNRKRKYRDAPSRKRLDALGISTDSISAAAEKKRKTRD